MAEVQVKLFDKWSVEDVVCKDPSLQRYISIKNHQFVAHSAQKWNACRFKKGSCPIVERLVNTLMMHGRNAGKKVMANRHVKAAFDMVHLQTGENPVQILVNGIQNGAIREDSCRIGKGGQVRRQAVDVAPLRRVNQVLFFMGYGARKSAMRKAKTFAECLADELIAAAAGTDRSYAVQKRNEIERVAVSNR
ncbi:Ribosomal_protein S7 [Hexamita inflata]|uniref:Ribosomal protein S7 n=1 Tax=Hexamita inflata TaxID=28002 RepID=A0AA86QUN6_9EUKA|nr:Ribosomal protein S7 [Hexamita inflata]CAI9932157.1 Ribosomal protein S7 [Hexamita inflata]CAI9961067.1 Ribosomal protein S7 [Hexamita inflata]CAI9971113.1 Ribosomal protein S7 [Hexamita inflata]CAI9971118.1 Ribosomal protein S7 [Hexamita inflata]